MIISPCTSHAFGVPVVGDDVVVISEFFVADRTFSVLLNDLSVQELAHFAGGPEFPVTPWVVRIFNALHAHTYSSGPVLLSHTFSAAAKQRSVYGTIFIATQPHNVYSSREMRIGSGRSVAEIRSRRFSPVSGLVQFLPEGKHAESGRDSAGVEKAAGSSTKRAGATQHCSDGLGQPEKWDGRSKRVLAARKRNPMSVAARKKIAAAQRARWAKWKKNKQNK